jgi:hypothetical protein
MEMAPSTSPSQASSRPSDCSSDIAAHGDMPKSRAYSGQQRIASASSAFLAQNESSLAVSSDTLET